MGGTKDIWSKSKNNLGIEVNDKQNFLLKLKSWEQKVDDKKLEFFTYSSGFRMGFEKISKGGLANKVHQGSGPFILTFKDFSNIVIFFLFFNYSL